MFPKGDDGKAEAGSADYVDTYKAMEECQRKGETGDNTPTCPKDHL